MRYPRDTVDPEIGHGLDDRAAIIAALQAGPLEYPLPLVAAAMRYTRRAVGGPLWAAAAEAVAAGLIRVIPNAEARARGLKPNGWHFCEDVR